MGIDIGSYSSKGVLTTPTGDILAARTIEHGLSIPRPGWAEHDPEKVWWTDFCALCHQLLDATGLRGSDVRAVAVSAIGPCLVPVDTQGRALRPAILYGIDTRATTEIDYLNSLYGERELYVAGGSVLSSQAVGPKLLWLQRHDPDAFNAAASFHSASDFVVLRLTGQHVMDAYTASLYNPLFSFDTGTWTPEYAAEIIDINRLPPVHWPTDIAGVVTNRAGTETGLSPGTPVTVGTVDAVSEAVSVGAVRAGDLMCMYGTTTFFILASNKLASHPTMWTVNHAFPGIFGIAAGMSTTGALTHWFRDNFARDLLASGPDDAYTSLTSEATSVPRGSNGLLVLPYFSGERTPINDPDARGVICGLSLAHERRHIFRAILEGASYGIDHNLQTMRASGAEAKRIVAVGGGAKNELWLQIVSDVSNVRQQVPYQTIGASYGDAFLAGYASGIIPSLDALESNWVRIKKTIQPDPEGHADYRPYVRAFHDLRAHTVSDQHASAAVQGRAAAAAGSPQSRDREPDDIRGLLV
jgi:xylulokinase